MTLEQLMIVKCMPLFNRIWRMFSPTFISEHKNPDMVDSISYQMLARIGWGISLTIQILVCQCGLGGFINSLLSWKGWIVLSRLTYSVYLLHLGLLNMMSYQTRHAFFVQPDYQMVSCATKCLDKLHANSIIYSKIKNLPNFSRLELEGPCYFL